MTKEAFMRKIGLPDEAIRQVTAQPLPDETYLAYRRQFLQDEQAFFAKVEQTDNYLPAMLDFFVRMAGEAEYFYREKQIPEQVYLDTFSDLAIWCRTCFKTYGVYGIAEGRWLVRHVRGQVFRLGRLQFEPIQALGDWCAADSPLTPGEPVLNVHIPEGEPMDGEAVRSSYRRAGAFFPRRYERAVCDSWLLCPALAALVRPQSNIACFAAQYQILSEDKNARQAEQRIFGQVLEQAADYPEDTSLQRAAKAYLVNGGKLGTAKGVLRAALRTF